MKKYWKYIILTLVGLTATAAICFGGGILKEERVFDVMRRLSDGFFVPGVIITAFGLLILASNGGVFDMLAFGIRTFFTLFKRDVKDRKYRDYYEYVQDKHKEKRTFSYFIIVGVGFIVVAFIFLMLYYSLS